MSKETALATRSAPTRFEKAVAWLCKRSPALMAKIAASAEKRAIKNEQRDAEKRTEAVYRAIKNNDIPLAVRLIHEGKVDTSHTCEETENESFQLSSRGEPPVVEALIEKGYLADYQKDHMFMRSLREDNDAVSKMLLDSGLDNPRLVAGFMQSMGMYMKVNRLSDFQRSCFFTLLEHGVPHDNAMVGNALSHESKTGDLRPLEALIARDTGQIHEKNCHENYPIQATACLGRQAAVELLAIAGVDLNVGPETSEQLARKYNHFDVANLLAAMTSSITGNKAQINGHTVIGKVADLRRLVIIQERIRCATREYEYADAQSLPPSVRQEINVQLARASRILPRVRIHDAEGNRVHDLPFFRTAYTEKGETVAEKLVPAKVLAFTETQNAELRDADFADGYYINGFHIYGHGDDIREVIGAQRDINRISAKFNHAAMPDMIEEQILERATRAMHAVARLHAYNADETLVPEFAFTRDTFNTASRRYEATPFIALPTAMSQDQADARDFMKRLGPLRVEPEIPCTLDVETEEAAPVTQPCTVLLLKRKQQQQP